MAKFLVLFTVFVCFFICRREGVDAQNEELIGHVNGKFIYDVFFNMNWLESGIHCRDRGWQIAELHTMAEVEFIGNYSQSHHLRRVALRDAMDYRQLVWDSSDGERPKPELFPGGFETERDPGNPRNCGLVNIQGEDEFHVTMYDCTGPIRFYCESLPENNSTSVKQAI